MDLDIYQLALWGGRGYLILLFLRGLILLSRLRLWMLQLVFLVGAGSYLGFSILTALGPVTPARPFRLLGLYSIAVCVHVLMTVLDTLVKKHSVKRLRPFDHD